MRLLNNSEEPVSYRITVRAAAMFEDGAIKFLERDEQPSHSANDLIRYSPRRGMLGPGQSQVVRFKLRKQPDLKPAEYYSFVRVLTRPEAESGKEQLSFSKQMAYNVPVFVRHGRDVDASEIWLDRATVAQNDKGQWLLSVWLNRHGQRSVYGDFKITEGRKQLALTRGISLYPNINQRLVKLSLSEKPEGELTVSYSENRKSGDLAAQLIVPVIP